MQPAFLLALCLSTLAAADDAVVLGESACKVVIPTQPAPDRATWKGPCKDGYAHGRGVLELSGDDDTRFEGRLERGALAEGYLTTASGKRYEGQFKDGWREGMGVLILPNGDRYDGAWQHGKRAGRGSQSYALGGRYDGDWKDDRFDGRGTVTYAGGHQRTGQFARGALIGAPQGSAVADAVAATNADTVDAAADDAERFKLKESTALTGSNIKRTLAGSRGVPFDKGYAEMTPAQQAKVRAEYALLEDGDEPPYPLKGSKQLFTWLSSATMRLGAPVGMLCVVVQVDSHGDASALAVYQTPDPAFVPVLRAMMLETKFKPAVCRGQPCAMGFPIMAMMQRQY